jgi:hypothetical protein
MINALQIIGNMPNFNLYIPANVNDFYGFINDLQSFNFLPTDWIFVWLGLANEIDQSSVTSNNSTNNIAIEGETVDTTRNLF